MTAPTHTREHQAALIRKAQAGSIEARNQLIEENLGLIYTTINKVKPLGSSSEEHVYAATEAFVRCVNSFDPDKGFTLSTYVCRSIPGEIYRLHNSLKGAIRVPELYKTSAEDRWKDARRARSAKSIPVSDPSGRQNGVYGGKQVFQMLVAKEPDPAKAEMQGKLWGWVADLPEPHREVATLALKGLNVNQISRATGIDRSTAGYVRHDAIHALKVRAARAARVA